MGCKLNTQEFITRASEIHAGKYDYSKSSYIHGGVKVVITCPVHGDFEQIPSGHLSGKGCSKCAHDYVGSLKKSSAAKFIEKATNTHNGYYLYSKVLYTTTRKPVTITCPKHGDFEQAPSNHLSGQGCKLCWYEKMAINQTLTTKEFIDKANLVHNYKYDYTKSNYVNKNEKVIITCPTHGDFEQKPTNHLQGSNCQECAQIKSKFQFDPVKPTTLYYVYFQDIDLYKIGITNRSVEQRFAGDKLRYIVLSSKLYPNGYLAWKHEQTIISKNLINKYDGPPVLYAGNSEMFTTNILKGGVFANTTIKSFEQLHSS